MLKYDKQVPVNPDVFRWLRESSGWTYGDISEKLEVSVDQVEDWESGKRSPTIENLKVLAKEYKRPLAAFLLPSPGEKQALPTDYRKLPDGSHSLSKKSLFAIRKARNMQTESSELMENLTQNVNADVEFVSIEDNPELVSFNERERMSITLALQRKWKNPYDVFNCLRDKIEHQNILVFQLSADLDDFRGFTLMDIKPFAIVVNSSDIIQARIFSLLHEYAHILLNKPAMCIPHEEKIDFAGKVERERIEAWCNRFAGSFLLPAKAIEADFAKFGLENYGKIARRYKVSLSTTLTRLVSLDLISRKEYRYEINKLQSAESNVEDEGKHGIGETSAKRARREKGDSFVTLVLENSQAGYITSSEALNYLDVKTRHMKELTESK